MPLIKDLISIPEQVNRGDFVLNLLDGVKNPDVTVGNYVVTEQLAKAFAEALTFLKSVFATPGGKSKATYLHGSFGSGKSHFMAILSLMLDGHEAVRNLPRLQPVVQANDWVQSKKFLLVPLHMLNRESMEQGILGGYAEFIRRKHPESPLPAFFKSNEIIANAVELRKSMGDEVFFARLNAGAATDAKPGDKDGGGWGDWQTKWIPETFAAALTHDPLHDDRRRLVSDIVQQLLPALRHQGDYTNLDEGLVAMSHHAKDLGYQGVILFLDELVLWLMSRAADPQFVGQEGPKIAALVEGKIAHAAIPIVSFVARQRDLREALGENMTGASHQAISNTMTWWEERFHTIVLEDRNLPVIAQERLLKPVSPEGKRQIDEAFSRTATNRQEVMEVLLTTGGSSEQFRNLYPFSPALVQVLVAVSGALQRERTALRILLQILCAQRNTLELGHVVPVGDLWDIIAAGEEVFAPQMRQTMDEAKKLWSNSLRPQILQDVGLPSDFDIATADPSTATAVAAFTMRARVAKTLLLTALVPGVESLRNLTAGRLAALNHGVITSPIPRQEGRTVLKWLKDWQQHVGQIKLNGENDPVVSLELSDVDTDAIIRQARGEDNEGNRKRLVQHLLFAELGIPREERVFQIHTVEWRGTQREVEVRYLNVREANNEHLKAPADKWVVVLDYPFDEKGKTPKDDVATLQEFAKRVPKGSRTLAWLPNFLSQQSLKELGDLVIINYLLSGARLDGFTGHLNAIERQEAKKLLETRQVALSRKILNALEVAYGVSSAMPTAIDKYFQGPGEQLLSLETGFIPQNTEQPTLRGTLDHLIHQALEYQFPLHPKFLVPVKRVHLKCIASYVTAAVADQRHRTENVERTDRAIMAGIADPLQLGTSNETVFHLKRDWLEHFHRCMAQENTRQPTVSDLRDWCDRPQARGLSREVADLVIWTFAQQTDRRFFHHNVAAVVSYDQLEPSMDLREQTLPDEAVWNLASERAAFCFGHPTPKLRNSATVAQLTAAIRAWERTAKTPAQDLLGALTKTATTLRLEPDLPRLQTARAAAEMLNSLGRAGDDTVINVLADARLPADLSAVAKSVTAARAVADALSACNWSPLTTLVTAPGEVGQRAKELLQRVHEHLSRDQRDVDIIATLNTVNGEVQVLWVRFTSAMPQPTPVADPEAERRKLELQAENERLKLELEQAIAQQAQRQREADERRRQELAQAEAQRLADEQRERERVIRQQPIELPVADVQAAVTQAQARITDLAKANPGKRLRITIEIVERPAP